MNKEPHYSAVYGSRPLYAVVRELVGAHSISPSSPRAPPRSREAHHKDEDRDGRVVTAAQYLCRRLPSRGKLCVMHPELWSMGRHGILRRTLFVLRGDSGVLEHVARHMQ
eukprot:COSAG01_NODE_17503_length_1145_cov_2.086998_2_plen_110_part_00